jgi:hypothetical protein
MCRYAETLLVNFVLPMLFERPLSVARSATLVFRDCTTPQQFHIFLLFCWRNVHREVPQNVAWNL